MPTKGTRRRSLGVPNHVATPSTAARRKSNGRRQGKGKGKTECRCCVERASVLPCVTTPLLHFAPGCVAPCGPWRRGTSWRAPTTAGSSSPGCRSGLQLNGSVRQKQPRGFRCGCVRKPRAPPRPSVSHSTKNTEKYRRKKKKKIKKKKKHALPLEKNKEKALRMRG